MRKNVKQFLLLLSFVFFAQLSVQGQDVLKQENKNEFKKGSELGISIGIPAFISTENFSYRDRLLEEHFAYGEQWRGESIATGVINLIYTYRFKKWFELSGGVSYSGAYTNYYDNINDNFRLKENHHYTDIITTSRFVWLNKKTVKLYSSIGLGLSIFNGINRKGIKGNNDFEMYLVRQFTPLGIKAGKRVYGFAEISLGNSSVFAIGVGYNFNYKK